MRTCVSQRSQGEEAAESLPGPVHLEPAEAIHPLPRTWILSKESSIRKFKNSRFSPFSAGFEGKETSLIKLQVICLWFLINKYALNRPAMKVVKRKQFDGSCRCQGHTHVLKLLADSLDKKDRGYQQLYKFIY